MSHSTQKRFTHTDFDLMLARMKLSNGQKIKSMLDTREIMVGMIRGRLRKKHINLSNRDLNLLVLEEIERANKIQSRSFTLS